MPTTTARSPKSPTKAQDAHERLTALALELGPTAKMPTIRQLRRDLQVSNTTLDSALAHLESQKVIYRKQGAGIFVSPSLGHKRVGLVCDPTFFKAESSPFWQQLIQGARTRALLGGEVPRFYLAIPPAHGEAPLLTDLIEDVKARRIHGVIFIGHNPAAVEWIEQNGIPVVVFAGGGGNRVEIDIEQQVRLALEQLIARGCRQPALLVPWEVETEPAEEPLVSPQAMAFREGVLRAGLSFHADLVWEARALGSRVESVPPTRQEQGFQAVLALFGARGAVPSGLQPDGLVSADDMMTRGVLAGLRKLGLRVGHDVQLASHINRGSTVLQGEDEGIILVEVDPAAIVQQLFFRLERAMDGETATEPCVWIESQLRV